MSEGSHATSGAMAGQPRTPLRWGLWLMTPPGQLLTRLRWAFLLFMLFFVLTFTPQLLLQSPWLLLVRLLSTGLLLALGLWWVRCYRAGQFPARGAVLEVLAFTAAVLTPEDPYRALGLLFIAVNFRALYGTWRQVAAFTTAATIVFCTAVLFALHLGLLDRSGLLAYTSPAFQSWPSSVTSSRDPVTAWRWP